MALTRRDPAGHADRMRLGATLAALLCGAPVAASADAPLVVELRSDAAELDASALRVALSTRLRRPVVSGDAAEAGDAIGVLRVTVTEGGRRAEIEYRGADGERAWGGGETEQPPRDLLSWVTRHAVAVMEAGGDREAVPGRYRIIHAYDAYEMWETSAPPAAPVRAAARRAHGRATDAHPETGRGLSAPPPRRD